MWLKNKINSPATVKITIFFLVMLLSIKALGLDDRRLQIYKNHDVEMLRNPIQIPPNYMVYDLADNPVKIENLARGNITILAFWASWCGYCKAEFPQMDRVVPQLLANGINVIPIARGDETPQKIKNFFNRGNIRNVQSYTATNSQLHKLLGVNGYPTYVVVDRYGRAFAKFRPKWDSREVIDLFRQLSAVGQKQG